MRLAYNFTKNVQVALFSLIAGMGVLLTTLQSCSKSSNPDQGSPVNSETNESQTTSRKKLVSKRYADSVFYANDTSGSLLDSASVFTNLKDKDVVILGNRHTVFQQFYEAKDIVLNLKKLGFSVLAVESSYNSGFYTENVQNAINAFKGDREKLFQDSTVKASIRDLNNYLKSADANKKDWDMSKINEKHPEFSVIIAAILEGMDVKFIDYPGVVEKNPKTGVDAPFYDNENGRKVIAEQFPQTKEYIFQSKNINEKDFYGQAQERGLFMAAKIKEYTTGVNGKQNKLVALLGNMHVLSYDSVNLSDDYKKFPSSAVVALNQFSPEIKVQALPPIITISGKGFKKSSNILGGLAYKVPVGSQSEYSKLVLERQAKLNRNQNSQARSF